MTENVESLGDEPLEARRRVVERHDLPQGRDNIIAKIRAILGSGGVQKVTVEIGKPLKVERLVKAEETGLVEELIDDDLMNAARNGQMIDMPQPKGVSPHEYLFITFLVLEKKDLKAKAFLVHTKTELKKWFKLNADYNELFGVEVHTHPDIPEGTALLICSNPDLPVEIITSYRLTLDTPKEKKSEADSGKAPKQRALGQKSSRDDGKVGKSA